MNASTVIIGTERGAASKGSIARPSHSAVRGAPEGMACETLTRFVCRTRPSA